MYVDNVSSLQTTYNDDNSISLESNGSDSNGKIPRSTSTKSTDDVESRQSNSVDENIGGSICKNKIKKESREYKVSFFPKSWITRFK